MNINIGKVLTAPLLYILVLVVGFGYWYTNYLSMQNNTVSVSGYADTSVKNQVASFSAGVSSINDKKEVAVKEVNDKIDSLTNAVKLFGIPAEDIKTESISVYQQTDSYYDNNEDGTSVQRSKPGQWSVSNSISIKLRDVEKTSKLVDLLTASGATNVYGPNFTVSDVSETENGLVGLAIENAKAKATEIANKSGRKLGKILSISESSTGYSYPMYEKSGMGGGGAPSEAGTSSVSKTLYVTFELK
ncbi:hypothetical protein A2713_00510 [candidate division WWE3 bacterium RIFCSPHIGHO2_01_FULL_35_17]|uniref:SIMPL domain-containing protein n=1 Tax=candidate division WWE3 bacterium RIFCSPHIGHO2_01_FULL_35_17 TaxID=1802614 RepID=A0A1F4UQ99_UNCKA|nr:MAG: hypothetical protein A2713_00510 [candidate division WWE3 bacterium RIFCSPHIGHO2_01_FULL_35_17]